MRWGMCTAVLALACWGFACGAEAPGPELEQPEIKFSAAVSLNPTVPRPGERIYFNVDVANAGRQAVQATVEVTIYDAKNVELYRRLWENMPFKSGDRYDLLGNYLTEATSVGKPAFLRVRVLDASESGAVLLESQVLATFATSWDGGRAVTSWDAGTGTAPDAGRADGGR